MSRNLIIGLILVCAWSGPVRLAQGSGCPGSPDQSHGPDIAVVNITGPNSAAQLNQLALYFGADACNLGNEEVMWDACPATTHPVFGATMYKWYTFNGATRFEQLGQGWLKNGFAADQDSNLCNNCQPGNSTRLGCGCDDAYSATQMQNSSSLGPKHLVNAHTGEYSSEMCSVHPSPGQGSLTVPYADLEITNGGPAATLRYFCQYQYITPDDAAAHNQNNNASTREINVGFPGGFWNLYFGSNVTQQEIPAIRLWKTIDTGVVETDIETPEDDGFPGLVILAAKATDLGNGFWHYEYAVNNLNSDRSIGTFGVPCGIYTTVQNIGFRDVPYRGGDGIGGVNYNGTDWLGIISNGVVSWATTPFAANNNANAIRWGTLYNFRFDANVPPSNGNVTLQEFKVVTDVVAATIIPSHVECIKGDLSGDGLVDGDDIGMFVQVLAGGAPPVQKCAGDVQATPDGIIDDADIAPFVNCLLNGGCP